MGIEKENAGLRRCEASCGVLNKIPGSTLAERIAAVATANGETPICYNGPAGEKCTSDAVMAGFVAIRAAKAQ